MRRSSLGKMSGYIINCPCLNFRLISWWWELVLPIVTSSSHTDQKPGHNAFWDKLGRAGSIWCSLQIWEMKAAFEGAFKLEQSCHTECNIFCQQMQPAKDSAPDLRHSNGLSDSPAPVAACPSRHWLAGVTEAPTNKKSLKVKVRSDCFPPFLVALIWLKISAHPWRSSRWRSPVSSCPSGRTHS